MCREADEAHLRQHEQRGAAAVVELAKLRDDNIVMARERAHAVFGLLELLGFMSREEAYAWLGGALHLEKREACIGRLNPEQCDRLVELARALLRRCVDRLRDQSAGAKESA